MSHIFIEVLFGLCDEYGFTHPRSLLKRAILCEVECDHDWLSSMAKTIAAVGATGI